MLCLVFNKNSDRTTYRGLIKSAVNDKAAKGEPTTGNFLLDCALENFRERKAKEQVLKGSEQE